MKSLFVVLLSIISAVSARNIFSCLPGSVFMQDCNACTCSNDGLSAACTDMACPGDLNELSVYQPVLLQQQKVCEPSTAFKVYCNTCSCSSDGSWFSCTRMACNSDIWNIDGSLKVESTAVRTKRSLASQEKVCEPGTQFKDYCNTCGCADDGLSYICTRRMCDKNIWNKDGSLKIDITKDVVKRSAPKQICEPHSNFKDYCNTCFCNNDGTEFACTRMMCPPEIWNKDGSLKIQHLQSRTVAEPQQVCEPRSHFKDYCNTCACSEDGTKYGCTIMMCDENVWNKDGTRKIVDGEKN